MLFSLRRKFPHVIFSKTVEENEDDGETEENEGNSDTLNYVRTSRKVPRSSFYSYEYMGPRLEEFSLYDYTRLVSTVSESNRQADDISFTAEHSHSKPKVQRPLQIASPCETLVALIGSLSTNEAIEDAVQEGNVKTDARQNNLGFDTAWFICAVAAAAG